jgi:hypothetical protein
LRAAHDRNVHRLADYGSEADGHEAESHQGQNFNAGSITVRPKSVRGSDRLCWVITNTTLFQGTRLSGASSAGVLLGCGLVY